MKGAYQPSLALRPNAPFLYGAGDAGFNLIWVLYDSFFVYFLVQASGLPSHSLAGIVLFSRLADLVAGSAFGLFGSRFRSRFGVYRPYIIWGALPLCLVTVLLFTAPSSIPAPWLWTPGRAILFTLSVGVVFACLYSVTNAAYTALLSVITSSGTLRIRMASARFACAFCGTLAVQAFTMRGLATFANGSLASGFLRLTCLFVLPAFLLLSLCAAFTVETVLPESASPLKLRLLLQDIASARPLRWLLAAMVTCLIALSCRGGASPFYFQYTIGRPAWTGTALAANSLSALAVCLLVPALPQALIAPLQVSRFCAFAGILACLPTLFWTPSTLFQLILLQVFYGFSTGALVPALFAQLAHPFPATRALTPALQAALTLIALKAGSAIGALILSHAATQHQVFFHSRLFTLAPWNGTFTLLPSLFFAQTLLCLLLVDSNAESQVGERIGVPGKGLV